MPQMQVVEMKFFGGLSTDEIAHSLRPAAADEIPAATGAILALVSDVLAPR
jgi:hypothetical protein